MNPVELKLVGSIFLGLSHINGMYASLRPPACGISEVSDYTSLGLRLESIPGTCERCNGFNLTKTLITFFIMILPFLFLDLLVLRKNISEHYRRGCWIFPSICFLSHAAFVIYCHNVISGLSCFFAASHCGMTWTTRCEANKYDEEEGAWWTNVVFSIRFLPA